MDKAVLAGMFYVPEHLLPGYARDNFTFPNPQYLSEIRQGVRKPKSPRFINAYRETDGYVGFPPYAERHLFLPDGLEVQDIRVHGTPISFEFNTKAAMGRKKLYDEQLEAKMVLAARGHGILKAPPGSGKTNVGIWLAAEIGKSTIILVHTNDLAKQWHKRFWEVDKYTGEPWTTLPKEEVCLIGDGKKKYNGEAICIATFQTMFKSFQDDYDFNNAFGVCIVDECLDPLSRIDTPHGEALLRDLHPGHRIWSLNFDTKQTEEDIIIAESEKEGFVYEVKIMYQGHPKTIRCSGNHPFFLPDGTKIETKNLIIGTKVLTV